MQRFIDNASGAHEVLHSPICNAKWAGFLTQQKHVSSVSVAS